MCYVRACVCMLCVCVFVCRPRYRGVVRAADSLGAQPLSAHDRSEMARVEAAVDALAGSLDAAAPWMHPDAAALDAQSVGAWLEAELAASSPAALREWQLYVRCASVCVCVCVCLCVSVCLCVCVCVYVCACVCV